MVNVRHRECGQVAFRIRCTIDQAADGVIMCSATMEYDDGRVIVDDDGAGVTGSRIRCQACGADLSSYFPIVGDEIVAYSLQG